jgi:hypothetical protein
MRINSPLTCALSILLLGSPAWAIQVMPDAPIEEITIDGRTDPDRIVITGDTVTDRPYDSLGYISFMLRAEGRLDPPTTPESLARALRRRAARLGADAVIQARFYQMGGMTGGVHASGLAIALIRQQTGTPPPSSVKPAAPAEVAPEPQIMCDDRAAGGLGQFTP